MTVHFFGKTSTIVDSVAAQCQRPVLFRNVPFKILTADPRIIRFMNVDIWSYLVKSANLPIWPFLDASGVFAALRCLADKIIFKYFWWLSL